MIIIEALGNLLAVLVFVFGRCHVWKILIGDSNVSPSVLANLWKEEEARTKTLEEKMRVLLKDKEVSQLGNVVILTGFQDAVTCSVFEERRVLLGGGATLTATDHFSHMQSPFWPHTVWWEMCVYV